MYSLTVSYMYITHSGHTHPLPSLIFIFINSPFLPWNRYPTSLSFCFVCFALWPLGLSRDALLGMNMKCPLRSDPPETIKDNAFSPSVVLDRIDTTNRTLSMTECLLVWTCALSRQLQLLWIHEYPGHMMPQDGISQSSLSSSSS